MKAAIILFLAVCTASSCAQDDGAAATSSASPGTRAACRQRAEDVYTRQNRADIYRDDAYASGARDAPFATTSVFGEPTRVLSSRYAREKLVDNCVRGGAGNVGSDSSAPDPLRPGAPPTLAPKP